MSEQIVSCIQSESKFPPSRMAMCMDDSVAHTKLYTERKAMCMDDSVAHTKLHTERKAMCMDDSVVHTKLCMGIRVDGKSCTRQKKRGLEYCGIHCPPVPDSIPPTSGLMPITHIATKNGQTSGDEKIVSGSVKSVEDVVVEGRVKTGRKIRKDTIPSSHHHHESHTVVELIAEEIRGIIYYVDTAQRVYNIEDILDEKVNPRVVGKLILNRATGHKEFSYEVEEAAESTAAVVPGSLCTIDSLMTTVR